MDRFIVVAPTAEAAADIAQRLRPSSEVLGVNDVGPTNETDVADFHLLIKSSAMKRRQNPVKREYRKLAKALASVNRELDRAESAVAQTDQKIIASQRQDLANLVGKLDSAEIARREAELNHRAMGW